MKAASSDGRTSWWWQGTVAPEWRAVALLFAAHWSIAVWRATVDVALPAALLDADLDADPSDFVRLLTAGTVAYVAGKLLCSCFVDKAITRWGPRAVLVAALLSPAVGAGTIALVTASLPSKFGLPLVYVGWAAARVLESAAWPSMTRTIQAWFPGDSASKAWGVLSPSSRVGYVSCDLLYGALLEAGVAWGGLFAFTSVVCTIAAVVVGTLLQVPSSPTGFVGGSNGTQPAHGHGSPPPPTTRTPDARAGQSAAGQSTVARPRRGSGGGGIERHPLLLDGGNRDDWDTSVSDPSPVDGQSVEGQTAARVVVVAGDTVVDGAAAIAPAGGAAPPPPAPTLPPTSMMSVVCTAQFMGMALLVGCLTSVAKVKSFFPLFMVSSLGLTPGRAAAASALFSIGGGVSAAAGGFVWPRCGRVGRALLVCGLIGVQTAALVGLSITAATQGGSAWFTIACALVIGLCFGLPYYVPSNMFALQYGGKHSSGGLTALLDIIGYAMETATLMSLSTVLHGHAEGHGNSPSDGHDTSDAQGFPLMWGLFAGLSAVAAVCAFLVLIFAPTPPGQSPSGTDDDASQPSEEAAPRRTRRATPTSLGHASGRADGALGVVDDDGAGHIELLAPKR